jgi:hypothetical protein
MEIVFGACLIIIQSRLIVFCLNYNLGGSMEIVFGKSLIII